MSTTAENTMPSFESLLASLDSLLPDESGTIAVIMLEACNMSRIDARFGRKHRDRMIETLKEQVDSSLRPQDMAVQIGDHSIAVVVPGLKNQGHAKLAAQKLHRVAEPETPEPARDKGKLQVRTGISLFPAHGKNAAELLQRAQLALEIAKDSRRDSVLFDMDHVGKIASSWEMRDDLAEAIRESELEVFYQPKIDIATGDVWGAEALTRWFCNKRGPVRPDQFIAVAEASDLIEPLTRYVLNSAMRSLMMWQRDGHDINIAINVPASMLLDHGLVDMMQSLLVVWDVEPHRLTMELTESAIMADVDACFATMTALKELGMRMSIDDFGTGYSSFSYFKTIPADELKIDRAFVANMVTDKADRHIVESITSLAHAFNMKVVAEGVEDEATINLLKELGCDVGQGYFIAKPMSRDDYDGWLDARRYIQPEH